MSEYEIDSELWEADARLRQLSRRVVVDPHHKRRIREELMRRHQEVSAVTSQRAAGTLWSRLTGTRRLTLAAPPALAVVLAIALFLSGVPFSHGNRAQAAEAARLAQAMTQTVPTVTNWQWTLREWRIGQGTTVQRLGFSTLQQRLRISNHNATLFFDTNDRWYRVPTTYGQSARQSYRSVAYWEWQVGALAQRLAHGDFALLPGGTIDGARTEGIRYALESSRHRQAIATAWVDRANGLVLRLTVAVTRSGHVIEQDTANYMYGRR